MSEILCRQCKKQSDAELIDTGFKKTHHGKVVGGHRRCDCCNQSLEGRRYYQVENE